MRGSVRAPRFFSVPSRAITAHFPGPYRPSCKPIADPAVRRDRVSFIFDELADGAAFGQPIRRGVLCCSMILL